MPKYTIAINGLFQSAIILVIWGLILLAVHMDPRTSGPSNPQGHAIIFGDNPNLKLPYPSCASRGTQLRLLNYIYKKGNKQTKTIRYGLIAGFYRALFPKSAILISFDNDL